MHTIPPLVLLAVRWQPAQSESVNEVTISVGLCQLNSITNLGLPMRYLPILVRSFQLRVLGADMSLAASFTEYWMSTLSTAN